MQINLIFRHNSSLRDIFNGYIALPRKLGTKVSSMSDYILKPSRKLSPTPELAILF